MIYGWPSKNAFLYSIGSDYTGGSNPFAMACHQRGEWLVRWHVH